MAQAVIQRVCFNIGLINDVQTIFIAQIIPTLAVGIMGCAHGVDVELLHQVDILQHHFFRDDFAQMLIMFMPIDTFHEHDFAIDV